MNPRSPRGFRYRPALSLALALPALALLAGPAPAQVVFGQVDNFQSGTVAGWTQGMNSPNPPTNIPNGGPAGAGDRYVQNISIGGFGAGSKMVMFNQSQWTGNYVAAGVTRISAQMANFGATPLNMRVAIQGGSGLSTFGSTTAHVVPPDGVWRSYDFDLTSAALTNISGINTLAETLGSVTTLRLLSAADGPSFNGDPLVGTLGVDNITAGAVPQPPRVVQTLVNGSTANQRSRVASLEVTFSTQVTFAGAVADAFTLSNNSGGAVAFTATANVVGGATVVTLNAFTGAETEFGSLSDGRYTLTALQNQISAGGQPLDGNGDGTGGDNYVFGDAQGLYRMYGDVSGLDRRVDISDFGFFSLAYLNPPNYIPALDFNNDGRIDIADFGQFSVRYFTSLP